MDNKTFNQALLHLKQALIHLFVKFTESLYIQKILLWMCKKIEQIRKKS